MMEDVYNNYVKNWKPESVNVGGDWIDQKLEDERPIPKDVFIHLIKTNAEFAKKWGVEVEVRELSLEERESILLKIDDTLRTSTTQEVKLALKELNIPTRAISLTCNNETIESYE